MADDLGSAQAARQEESAAWKRIVIHFQKRSRWRALWQITDTLGPYAAIVGMAAGLSLVFGFLPYLVIQLVVLAVAGGIGFWFFYVQHQFEGVYWERAGQWDYAAATLKGSSFYKLPGVM
jgi:fatty acid desaturase